MAGHESNNSWNCRWVVRKFRCGEDEPYEVQEHSGNMLTYGGMSLLWDRLINGGTHDPLDSSNAYIGVGDSTTAEAIDQTGLLGTATYKLATPSHTDGTDLANASVTWAATFGANEANRVWEEWGLFLGSGGRMLNRRVETVGTKVSGEYWEFEVTVDLIP